VSQLDRSVAQKAIENLGNEDRAWLQERLSEYRELLEYLHDH